MKAINLVSLKEEGSSTLNPETLASTTRHIHSGNDTVPVGAVVQRYRDCLINTIGVGSIILKQNWRPFINPLFSGNPSTDTVSKSVY